ncbi:MAG TPA: glycosyltransferase family 4 protein [Gemmatimonadaceae bacterium]|nr:glycosyltransferase family 4 protein [Gemmatimonadaceae bacterium]
MRILFCHAGRAWTGSTRVFASAARGLARRGHQVTFVCPPDSPVEQRLDYEAYEVLPMPLDGTWSMAAWRLRGVLDLRFVEVCFAHTEREQLIAAAASRMAERAAVVRRIAPGDPGTLARAGKMARRLAATGAMVALDEDVECEAVRGTPIGTVVVSPGVSVEDYDAVLPAPRSAVGIRGCERLIACSYDPTSRVRAAVVLRTLAMLQPRHPELGVAFVGPGSDSEELRMHAAALGVTSRVSFLGERGDYLSVLRSADLGWVVARSDDAIYAYLDLLALRRPVLATHDVMSQRYVANNIGGMLLEPDDPPGTAAAVARLLAHDDEREAMGEAGRGRVAREFTEGTMLDGFEEAVRRAADRTLWVR